MVLVSIGQSLFLIAKILKSKVKSIKILGLVDVTNAKMNRCKMKAKTLMRSKSILLWTMGTISG